MFLKELECKICKEKFSPLGLPNHVINRHKMEFKDYKKEFSDKFGECLNCGKRVIKPRKYCGLKCTNKMNVIKKSLLIKDDNYISPRKIYENLSDEIKIEIINFYHKDVISLKDVSENYDLDIEVVKKILKEFKIKSYSLIEIRKEFLKRKKEKFLESNEGKRIIEEYQKFGSQRYISKKYGIYKKTLRNLLLLAGVKIKSCKEAKRIVDLNNKKKGIRGHRYGKTPPVGCGKCDWYFYEGIKYQGSWEFKLGLWLNDNGIDFLCHKDVKQFEYELDGEKYTYCPDFYLISEETFIEVKGYFSEKDRRKIEIIRKNYPEIKLEIYNKKVLETLGIFEIDKKLGLIIEDYVLDYKTDDLHMDLIDKIGKNVLIKQHLVNKKNLGELAGFYNIPYRIMCKIFNKILPKRGNYRIL